MQLRAWQETHASTMAGYHIHRISARRPWSYPEHTHLGFCEIVAVTSGTLRHTINGAEQSQRAGHLLLIRAGDRHHLDGKHFSYVNVMFQPEWLKRLEHYTGLEGLAHRLLESRRPPSVQTTPNRRAALNRQLNQLLTSTTRPQARRLLAEFLLATLTACREDAGESGLPQHMPDWLAETLRWIRAQPGPGPTLAAAVRHSCRCHEHFTRTFHAALGMTPSAYLTGLRLDQAAEALITTNGQTAEIARSAGFENESYFFRAFRRRLGMTPLAYRKRNGPRSLWRHPDV